jgi:hypothetical protein
MPELGATFQKLLNEIAKANQWEFRTDGDACVVTVAPRADRTQQVRITTGVDHLKNPTLVVQSDVGLLQHVTPERALRANARTCYAALAAVGEDLVMRGTLFVGEGSLSARELTTIIQHVAHYADQMERDLYGQEDRF